jgi:hypothetical protein
VLQSVGAVAKALAVAAFPVVFAAMVAGSCPDRIWPGSVFSAGMSELSNSPFDSVGMSSHICVLLQIRSCVPSHWTSPDVQAGTIFTPAGRMTWPWLASRIVLVPSSYSGARNETLGTDCAKATEYSRAKGRRRLNKVNPRENGEEGTAKFLLTDYRYTDIV